MTMKFIRCCVLLFASTLALSGICDEIAIPDVTIHDNGAATYRWDPNTQISATDHLNTSIPPTPPLVVGPAVEPIIGADRFHNAGYTGQGTIASNIESGHIWSGHETAIPLQVRTPFGINLETEKTERPFSPWMELHERMPQNVLFGLNPARYFHHPVDYTYSCIGANRQLIPCPNPLRQRTVVVRVKTLSRTCPNQLAPILQPKPLELNIELVSIG